MKNRITITRDLFFEGILTVSQGSCRRAAKKAVLVLLAIWLVLLVFTVMTKGSILPIFAQLGLVGAICIIMCVLMPRANAKRVWKAMEARYGSTPERVTTFLPDHLKVRGDCAEKDVPYTKILQVRQSARLLILICEDKTGILLALDGFTGITAGEVISLIENAKMA